MSHKWIKNHGGQFSANFKENQFNLGYVWFPQSTKKRKTMLRKMIFSYLASP